MKIIIVVLGLLAVGAFGKQGFGPTEQDWGYVTVRQNAHMFWWLHYTNATVVKTQRPLIIWLQGGPGSSSTGYGNFFELGPLDQNLEPRKTSWDKYANLLFVDNPVGTGFSYVDNVSALTTTNEQIALDFVELLKGFYKAVPDMKKVPLYIFSESYGGKMTADIALAIDKAVKAGTLECKLQGVGLGDSWISPIDSTLTWAPYLKSLGMVDEVGYGQIMKGAQQAETYIKQGQYAKATTAWSYSEELVNYVTGGVDFYNIITKFNSVTKKIPLHQKLLSYGDNLDNIMKLVQKALNISTIWGYQSNSVFVALREDFMKPVVTSVEKLLSDTNITVAVYNGQLDLIVDPIGTLNWLDSLKWKGSAQWKTKMQVSFEANFSVEGYQKIIDKFQYYLILRAGHMVPADNPAGMLHILQTVTNNFAV